MLQNLFPSFPWIAPGWRAWGARKGRDQMLLSGNTAVRSFVALLRSFSCAQIGQLFNVLLTKRFACTACPRLAISPSSARKALLKFRPCCWGEIFEMKITALSRQGYRHWREIVGVMFTFFLGNALGILSILFELDRFSLHNVMVLKRS